MTKHINLQESAHLYSTGVAQNEKFSREVSLLNRFINLLMKNGKKRQTCRTALDSITSCKLHQLSFQKREDQIEKKEHIKQKAGSQEEYSTDKRQKLAKVSKAPRQKRMDRGAHITTTQIQSSQILVKSISAVEPSVELSRVGARSRMNYKPFQPHNRRKKRTAVRWIISNSQSQKRREKEEQLFSKMGRGGETVARQTLGLLSRCIGQELSGSINKQSQSVKQRDQAIKHVARYRSNIRS